MKVFKFTSMIFCLFSLLGLFSSCEKEAKSEYDSFIIYVDSVQLSDNISANIPFDIFFYGTVGTNGCYEFSHFS